MLPGGPANRPYQTNVHLVGQLLGRPGVTVTGSRLLRDSTGDLVFDIRAIASVKRLRYRNRRFRLLIAAAHPAHVDRE
jgi:hypothetical protein